MNLIETNRDPSARERKALAIALCALGGVFALMILYKPASLVLITAVSGVAWCASMLFNRDEPIQQQFKSVIVPLTVGLIYAAVWYFESQATIAIAAFAALAALGIVVWLHESFGRRFYTTWTQLFQPVAWSVSTFLLVLIYYGVITPIGLIMRLVGRDPMLRKFDRDGTSYWVKRNEAKDPERYFRQF